jgi:hypothetical protein
MASIDQLIGGSFESLGLPRLSQSEQLQWLQDYSQSNPALTAYNTAATAPAAAQPQLATSVPTMSAYAPQQSTSPAVAAATAAGGSPVTSVTGQMKPTGLGGFDLMSLFTGPSKNGLGGLPGLLGGPQQGGILQMLFGGGKNTAGLPRQAPAMTSAQKYAALNSGPGSVAAMERLHSGQSRNPQSGGPASGGEYASGGR